jgi:hypothetical protein
MGLSFTIAAGLAIAVILWSESRGTHDQILLSQIRDFPNPEGQVPVFISSRNRMAQLYPQALRSLFVASYDSQSYGGGIRTCPHTGYSAGRVIYLRIRPIENTASNSISIVARGPRPSNSSSTLAYLRSCCLAVAVVSFVSLSLPSSGSVCHNMYRLSP